MRELFLELSRRINGPEIQAYLWPWQLVLGSIGILLVAAYIILFMKSSWFQVAFGADWREFLTFRAFGLRPRQRLWKKIRKRLETEKEGERRRAVEEAHHMLKEILSRMGIAGGTVAERLKNADPFVFIHKEALLGVQGAVENILQSSDTGLSQEEAERIIRAYEQVLADLDVV